MEELDNFLQYAEEEIYNNEQEINNLSTNLIEFRAKKIHLEKKNVALKEKICYLKLIDDYGYALINKMHHSYFDTLSGDEQYNAEYFNDMNPIDHQYLDPDIFGGWYHKNTIYDINNALNNTPKIIYEEELLNNVIKSYSIFHSYHPSEIELPSEILIRLRRPNTAFNRRIWDIIRSAAGLEGWINYMNENTNDLSISN